MKKELLQEVEVEANERSGTKGNPEVSIVPGYTNLIPLVAFFIIFDIISSSTTTNDAWEVNATYISASRNWRARYGRMRGSLWKRKQSGSLSRATSVDLAEGKLLELVVKSKNTSLNVRNPFVFFVLTPATPLKMFAPAPLKRDLVPSAATI